MTTTRSPFEINPIIRRELLDLLRTRKALALQVGLALACALLVLLRWPTGETADLTGARSLQVLRVFGYGLLAGILLIVPAFPATTLVREKIKGTLALLLNSPMRPWSIYLGKLGGVLGFTAILLTMTLPAAAACYALGGTGAQGGILSLYGVLILAAVQLVTLGLLVSSRAQSIDGSLRVTYAFVLALCVLSQGPYELLRGSSGPIAEAASWLRCVCPIPAVMELLGQADVGSHGMASSSGAVLRYLILGSLTSLIFAFATVARLNHKFLDRSRAAGVMTEDRSEKGQAIRGRFFLIDPQKRSESMSLWVNPVMVKESRSRRFGRSHWTLRLVAICAILSLVLSYIAAAGALGWGIEVIGGVLVLLQIALLILFAPSLAAGLISSERESGSWSLLRMTPMSPGAIVRGKLYSVVVPLLMLLCATLPGYIVMMTVKPELVPQVYRVVACLAFAAVFAIMLSAAASTVFRATATATAASYMVLLAVCVGPLLVWLGRDAPFGHDTVETALIFNPISVALQASGTPGFESYALVPLNWWFMGSVSILLFIVLSVRTWVLCRPE